MKRIFFSLVITSTLISSITLAAVGNTYKIRGTIQKVEADSITIQNAGQLHRIPKANLSGNENLSFKVGETITLKLSRDKKKIN